MSASGGRIVDTAGDGAFVVFPSATSAVEGVVGFQRAMARANDTRGRHHQLQVRMGLHWGPVLTDGVAVSGDAVNLCSRLTASAMAGEVRLTRATFHELEREHRLNCRSLGEVNLPGYTAPVELLAIEWRDQTLFPRSLRIEETGETINLPRQDIVTLGRWEEIDLDCGMWRIPAHRMKRTKAGKANGPDHLVPLAATHRERPFVSVDRAHEGADPMRLSNRRHVRGRERAQRALEVRRRVAFGASCSDGVPVKLANYLSFTMSCLDGAAGLDPSHDLEDFGSFQRTDWRGPDPREYVALKSTDGPRELGFADLELVDRIDPLPRESLERAGFGAV